MNLKTYTPKLPIGSWFRTQFKYTGYGIAQFQTPDQMLTISGKVDAQVSEGNPLKLLMFVDKTLDSRGDKVANLRYSVSGGNPFLREAAKHSEPAKCVDLQIELFRPIKGKLVVHGTIQYDFALQNVLSNNKVIRFEADAIGATYYEFIANNAREPKYWLMPILNYVMDEGQLAFNHLHQHPLRVGRISPIKSNLDASKFEEIVKQHPIVSFNYYGKLGFIEHLQDFHIRKQKLDKNRSNLSLITSIMVGEIIQPLLGLESETRTNPQKLLSLLERV